LFGRRSTSEADASGSTTTPPVTGKGRATPKRREAVAARKQRYTAPKTRKEASRQLRQRRLEQRAKLQEGLRSGDERLLPTRDRGPVRRFARDFIDARFNVAEFLLPMLIVILFVSFAGQVVLQGYLWTVTIFATTADTLFLWWRLKRELKRRFPDQSIKGSVLYGVLRSSQLRRLRLPKPQVKRGETLRERY
jgi:Flp pilus assembly protein TadB